MRTLKNFFIVALLLSAVQLQAQTDKATTIKILDAQQYVFVATSASPLNASDINQVLTRMPGYTGGAGNIILTGSNYDLSVTPDSVVAYLPYYGRSYTPKMGGIDEGGIKFKSKKFSYKKTARKKGGWIITIIPKDVKDNYSLTLTTTESGYASLTVTNNTQQPITFSGNLAAQKPVKEKAVSPE
jgi:hypothetical protein